MLSNFAAGLAARTLSSSTSGPGTRNLCSLMRAGGVLVRDRSSDPGCEGRVRITIGTREQMRHAVATLSEALDTLQARKDAQ